ncbi:hypothetical protein TNCV_4463331 [Trichonephila clavipes]|nr:hypothetical protein TNCV_4463331 [Trichonephila clavipes]
MTAYLRQCLTAWLLLRWIDDSTTAAREGCGSLCTARITNERRRVQSGYLPFQTRVLYLPHQNDRLQVDSEDIQNTLDSHNQELTVDELIDMHEQKQNIEDLESLDPVHSEDRMTIGNLTEGFSV